MILKWYEMKDDRFTKIGLLKKRNRMILVRKALQTKLSLLKEKKERIELVRRRGNEKKTC